MIDCLILFLRKCSILPVRITQSEWMGYKCNKRSLGQLSNAASFIDIDFDNNTGIQWHFKPTFPQFWAHLLFEESSLVFFLVFLSLSPRFNHLYSFVSIPFLSMRCMPNFSQLFTARYVIVFVAIPDKTNDTELQ